MATVEEVLRVLGDVVSLAVPAPRSAAPLESVSLWEGETNVLEPGGLLVGAGLAGEAADTLIAAAGRAGCVGVVLREPESLPIRRRWAARARDHGMALLLVPKPIPMLRVLAAVSDALAGNAEATGGTTAADEPTKPADEQLTGTVPTGDLFALADAFAGLVGGPIIIEDANFRVLGFSSFTGPMDRGRDTAILGRRIPQEWLEHLRDTGSLDLLRRTDQVVDVQTGPWQAHRRMIVAVRTRTELLGILWVAEGERPLPGNAAEALRTAAGLAIPHLLRHQEGHRAERRRSGQLVQALLDGRGRLYRHADDLGLPRHATVAVLAFAPAPTDDSPPTVPDEVWERIADHVALTCETFRWRFAVAHIAGAVFTVLVLPSGTPEDAAGRLGREIVNRSGTLLDGALCGGMSTVGTGLGSLHTRKLEAGDALNALREGAAPSGSLFVEYAAIQPHIILREVGAILAQRGDLWLPGLRALETEDGRRGSEHLHTLRTYLRAASNAGEAARRLDIHPTTLRYRLSRIQALSGLDLSDPTVRLVCQLLLAVQPLPAGSTGSMR